MSEEKNNIGILFPGQGSQSIGMAKELTSQFAWTKEVYEEASESIKIDLFKLIESGSDSDLALTENAQPAILTTSFAWLQVLRREYDFKPRAAAGHSLGEYSALLCSGALSLSEAVSLVKTRGAYMQNAVPVGKGKMAALIGLDDEAVMKLCEKATKGVDSIVVAANYNAPGQVVIAGHAEAVDRAQQIASGEDKALKARKFMPLNVSAPFHSPLMTPVAEKFEEPLTNVNWNDLQLPIAFNVDGIVLEKADVVALMKKQIDHPVRWVSCVNSLIEFGCERFVEPGPGKVLSGLGRRINREAKCMSVESLDAVKEFEGWLNE